MNLAGSFSELLVLATRECSQWLGDRLPALDEQWWSSLVLSVLTYQQRQQVDRHDKTTLDQFDLAALLRILDANWYPLYNEFRLSQEDRHFVKEMMTVRNRWSHMDGHGPCHDDAYRDLDTLQRFINVVGASDAAIAAIKEVKASLLAEMSSPDKAEAATKQPAGDNSEISVKRGIEKGSLVCLKSDPSRTGAVLEVEELEHESRCTVFIDNKQQVFYASQLQPVTIGSAMESVSVGELHAILTGLQISHPSLSTLYSLNAARVDFVPYQFRPALKIIASDQPRLLIADGVGVGKTIEAGLILRELQARNNVESVLIICPRPLVAERKWELEMKRFEETFSPLDGEKLRFCIHETDLDGEWPDSYRKAIIPYSLFDESVVYGSADGKRRKRKGLLDLDPPPRFDLVIVDEAHHVRNSDTFAHQAVRLFCENAEAVIFLTATPLQMGDQDLYTLLNLLRPDLVIDMPTFKHMAEPNPFINAAAKQARAGGDDWHDQALSSLAEASRTPWGQAILNGNPLFRSVCEKLSEERSTREERVAIVRQIEGFHSFDRLINRTRRRDIENFCVRKPETIEVPFTPDQKQLHDALLSLEAEVLASVHGIQNVAFMMSTIRRQAASCIFGLAPFMSDIVDRRISDLEWSETADGDVSDSEFLDSMTLKAMGIMDMADSLPPADPKFDALWGVLSEKLAMDNSKVIVFSSFRHTLAYLERRLREKDVRIGVVHGGVKDDDRLTLRERFESWGEDANALDVMLFSEVGCEGLDYQFCDTMLNYDLPWNPMRIEQRIGRIDRRGQKSEVVVIYNLITPGTIDADIYNRCLRRIGVFEESIGECDEILGDIHKQIRSIVESVNLSDEEKRIKLEQLSDNEIRKLKEQREVEEREHELFGVRIPKLSSDSAVQESESYWLTAQSIQSFVTHYLHARLGKQDYILGKDSLKSLRLSQDARNKLLEDFRNLEAGRSPLYRSWEKWLKGNEPSCSVTFESSCAADRRDSLFIMPLHPLVLQAAAFMHVEAPVQTAIRVSTPGTISGQYTFAIYAWEYQGLRPELRLVPVCESEEVRLMLLDYIQSGIDADCEDAPPAEATHDDLDKVHHDLWQQERASHLAKTRSMCAFRRESLETSNRGRLSVAQGQLDAATDENIRRMKQAQILNIEAEYVRKSAELSKAENAADIHARPVAFGLLRMEG